MRGAQFVEALVDLPPEVAEALLVPRVQRGLLRELPEPLDQVQRDGHAQAQTRHLAEQVADGLGSDVAVVGHAEKFMADPVEGPRHVVPLAARRGPGTGLCLGQARFKLRL